MIGILNALFRDLRSTGRLLAARPGWTIAAILCLAIASGANTAAFSLVNGLLLRPLPFDEPEQLVMVALREPLKTSTRPFSLREYRELSNGAEDVATLFARTFFPASLSADDGAQMAQMELVSGNYFEALHIKPFDGRFFDALADRAGGEVPAVLSETLWRRRFGADPSVIGRSMRANGQRIVIVGIAPPRFVGATQLVAADLWLPAAVYPALARSATADTVPMFGVMGRLASHVTIDQARTRLASLAAMLPHTSGAASAPTAIVDSARGFGVPVAIEGAVITLSGFIYLMLTLLTVVACANVAALVLARGTGRTREIAVRLSLGASRVQIARQLLTESLVLALAGCAAGTVVALWLTQALVARLATPFQYVSYAIDVHPDTRVFAYSALTTAFAVMLCGIAPIRYAARVDVVDLLKHSAAKGRSRASGRTLNAMVVMQLAVSTTLLVGAGMLVRSYINAQLAHPVFDTSDVVATTIDVNQLGVDRVAGTHIFQDVVERLSAIPGTAGVSLTRDLPFGSARTVTITHDFDAASRSGEPITAAAMLVSPSYFQTLGIAIREGRGFHDAESAPAAIINDSMARRLSSGANALGRQFRIGGTDGKPVEVIGIVPDTTIGSLGPNPQPMVYRPFPQEFSARMTILTRVHGDAATLFAGIRRTIRDVNPDLSIVDLRTVDRLLDDKNAQARVPATLLSIIGLLGLLLSAVGLYGVVAYAVRERAREFGIRLALGARPGDVRFLVLRQGLTIVAIGLGLGVLASIGAVQIMREALFGVGSLDSTDVAVVGAVLLTTALAALYLPARWASRLEPAETLRSE